MREYHLKIDRRMFDFSAFYDVMAKELPDHCIIAEVGVADGASAIYLAEALLNIGKPFKMYMIDSLDYGEDSQLSSIVHHIIHAGISEIEIMPHDSLNASCNFPDNYFDFVFIDASHKYELTKADIRLWYHKIKENGILAGHDMNQNEGKEVHRAITEVISSPLNALKYFETEKQYGVWYFKKTHQIKIN